MIRIGDRRQGSPGIRVQTFSEPTFEFKVLVDAFATYNYVELPEQPVVAVVAGPPVLYKAILPTARRVGQAFSLGFKGEDKWGNPSDRVAGRFTLEPNMPVAGLPSFIDMEEGIHTARLDNLSVAAAGELRIAVKNKRGEWSATRTPCASSPKRRCCPTGPTCTASPKKPSARTRRGNSSNSRATARSSTR